MQNPITIILIAVAAILVLFFILSKAKKLIKLILGLFLVALIPVIYLKIRGGLSGGMNHGTPVMPIILLLFSIVVMFILLKKIRKSTKHKRTGGGRKRSYSPSYSSSSTAKQKFITYTDVKKIVIACVPPAMLKNYNMKITSDCVYVDISFKPNWDYGVRASTVNEIASMISEYGINAEVNEV
jgi:uncharacterized membrane protein